MDTCHHHDGLILHEKGHPYIFCPDCRSWQWLAGIAWEPDCREIDKTMEVALSA